MFSSKLVGFPPPGLLPNGLGLRLLKLPIGAGEPAGPAHCGGRGDDGNLVTFVVDGSEDRSGAVEDGRDGLFQLLRCFGAGDAVRVLVVVA
jgi:hypothetical protein